MAFDCRLKNARVSNHYERNSKIYYIVSNLGKKIHIPINELDKKSELLKALKKSEMDKSLFLTLQLDDSICEGVMTTVEPRGFEVAPQKINSTFISNSTSTDCIECNSYLHAPIAIKLPPFSDMNDILARSAGLSPDKIHIMSNLLKHLFERMNNKQFMANSLVFTVSIFKAFEALNVKEINQDQLMFLAEKFKEELTPMQGKLLDKIYRQIDSLKIIKIDNNSSEVTIVTKSKKPITILGNDIPTLDNETKEYMDKHFHKVDIDNNTKLTFTNQKSSNELKSQKANQTLNDIEVHAIVNPTNVAISGIKVLGEYPIVGNFTGTPKIIDIDIDDKVPAKAKVDFSNGFIGFSYTFDLDN
jgi:hypothetical protein